MWELVETILQSKLFWSTTFIVGIYMYLKFVIFSYWEKLGVPHDAPTIPIGNMLPVVLGKICTGRLFEESYRRYKSQPFHGLYLFHNPHLVINDPDLIRLVLVKDFSQFHDRGLYFNNDVDPLSGHLVFLPGEKWKYLRSKLSPTFTSGKMKQMFPLIEKIGENFKETLSACIEKSSTVDIKDLLSRYFTDLIASIGFGVECNSLKNPNEEFRQYGMEAISINPLKLTLGLFFSKACDVFRIPFISKNVSTFFNTVFRDVINHRQANRVERKDFLNLLIQLMEYGEVQEDVKIDSEKPKSDRKNENPDTISMSVACAQVFVFFVAGFETSSSTTTYCLHELALNTDIQDKLRKEIIGTLGDRSKLTYEELHAMPYLDKVVSETLRKYPIVPFLNRVCLKDYKIPNSDFCIKKDMNIIISVLALHNDPELFDNPQEFRPERFDPEEIAKRHAFTYLPFGEGPRICIGKRFGLLQVKVALIKILSQFKVSISEKTQIPLIPTLRNVLISPEGSVFLRLEKI